ncbi:TMEM165/GDT1 family protein [Saccharomonospora halophila]|uniref:TMEM165/GDT1 family protein n=1 Tax=Saccharomonospora halophila TaxID=129922 RepID=UPI00036DB722|nr:TMEM165/GDT1 family protein [Saccharomonospora halophila]
MTAELVALVSTFALVAAVELPDKTTVATLVLTTRFPVRAVLLGIAVAFALQTVVAVTFGGVLTALPDVVVSVAVGTMFGIGAAMLLREGFQPGDDDSVDAARSGRTSGGFVRASLASFAVLFTAEWGDASQLTMAGLAADSARPLAVAAGSLLAVLSVSGLAVLVGRKLRDRIRPRLLQRVAGFLLAGLAALAFGSALV